MVQPKGCPAGRSSGGILDLQTTCLADVPAIPAIGRTGTRDTTTQNAPHFPPATSDDKVTTNLSSFGFNKTRHF